MAVLSFSLTPEATGRVHDALVCLAKFGEYVAIEARAEKLTITALNLSKTAYAAFALEAVSFFAEYQYDGSGSAKRGDRFTCQLLNKALQSVFKARGSDGRGRESLVERCDVVIQDQPDKTECRLIVKMLCKHGMTKTYRLTYESVEVMHALFDRTVAKQGWRISSRVLREYIEFFGPKTEQLDLLAQEGKAIFTSFTEKIEDGKREEVLKQPLETAISLHTEDFEDFYMQLDMHIVISVKDFRAIVTHAETLRAPITARFSYPSRPLQFSYQNYGMHSEFTLMTTGDARAASTAPEPKFVSNRSPSRQTSTAPSQAAAQSASEMPPPPRPVVTKSLTSQSQSQTPVIKPHLRRHATEDPDADSLFMPGGDEDRTWDPPNYEQDNSEEMLGWDTSNELPPASFHETFRDSGSAAKSQPHRREIPQISQEGVEPTQRLSQVSAFTA
ncbi:hypothetical protein LTR62_004090 [Meristemomyces frigidus]|uniref:DNA repair protein rad9 n=1 Tax=Meristemomyces frigidus TaxID=1508187 RepID=A0AAN7YSG2_9PEZI|nr:hypothetical protein LTR62_004090 [Meristemomyces frigidus]